MSLSLTESPGWKYGCKELNILSTEFALARADHPDGTTAHPKRCPLFRRQVVSTLFLHHSIPTALRDRPSTTQEAVQHLHSLLIRGPSLGSLNVTTGPFTEISPKMRGVGGDIMDLYLKEWQVHIQLSLKDSVLSLSQALITGSLHNSGIMTSPPQLDVYLLSSCTCLSPGSAGLITSPFWDTL